MKNIYAEHKEEYEHLFEAFGVGHSGWDQIYRCYTPSMFCKDNRKSIIGQYLVWEEFIDRVKRYKLDLPYYCGIDDFLKEYKTAVYACLNNI